MRVFITGGSGELGSELRRRLVARGHAATVTSRSGRTTPGLHAIRLDLSLGVEAEAIAGHDTVVHLASDPFNAQRVDVDGSRSLVEAASAADVRHLLAISIVGVEGHPYPYYRAKAEMERIVRSGPVPWTILRATQFHSLVPRFIDMMPALGVVPVPRGLMLQPIDASVVATRLADLVEAGPGGQVPDLGGPEVLVLRTMVKDVIRARRLRRLIVPFPMPGPLGRAFRDGRMLTTPTDQGRTWAEYIAELDPVGAPTQPSAQ